MRRHAAELRSLRRKLLSFTHLVSTLVVVENQSLLVDITLLMLKMSLLVLKNNLCSTESVDADAENQHPLVLMLKIMLLELLLKINLC